MNLHAYVQECKCLRGDVCVRVIMVVYNGWLVTEGDNYYVDGGNDECFTMMMMIITLVVLVLLLSVID